MRERGLSLAHRTMAEIRVRGHVAKYITQGIDADWNVLSGGADTMSTAQLTAAIQQYLSVGGANNSG